MLLLMLLSAAASADSTVLVSRFEAADPEHTALARRLPEQVQQRLEAAGGLTVQLPSDVSYIQEQSGADFMKNCPSDQVLGCTFDLAEVAQTRWAVTGIVRYQPILDDDVEPDIEVELTVLDIEEQEEAWSLVLPHSKAAEPELVGWVERAVVALADGEPPPLPELEEFDEEPIDDEPFDPEQDLSGLEQELGEVGHPEGVEDLGEGRQEREPMTMDQLLEEYGEAEPWLDMDLTPEQYLRWWNSGWGYRTWQEKRQGRQGKFTIRAAVGGGSGPRGGGYNAQYAIESVSSRQVLEYYAWQAPIQGGGANLGLELAYGVAPKLDVELGLGTLWGPFQTFVGKEYLGDPPETVVDETGLQGVFELSLGARLVPMPFQRIRPVLGGGFVLWHGTKGDAHAELPPPPVELPIPAANTLLGAQVLAGGEFAINDLVSVVLQAPLQLFFAGTSANMHEESSDYIATKLQPPETQPFGWGVEAGVQIHLGGK